MAYLTVRAVWFWRELYASLREFCRVKGLPFNRVVNLAVSDFLKSPGSCDVERLRLQLRLEELMREEHDLRRVWATIGRSGSYLPQYVDRVLRPQRSPFHQGQVPLRALSVKEEEIFRRVAARREAVAQEIVLIQDQLLPKEKFRLKPEPTRSRSRAHDKSKPFSAKGGA
jgi:hypothetical protein